MSHFISLKVLLITLFLLLNTAAGADPYNSYLWNRDNVIAKNGEVDRGNWYEWWFYKVVDPVSDNAFLFTYGIVNPWDLKQERPASRAFLQFGESKARFFTQKNFPVANFQASYERTEVRIADNHATDKQITGAITDELGRQISWDLKIKHEWHFNAMGWTMSAPIASGIYWYPAQASARMNGWIRIDDRIIAIKNAPAYQDRNWGRSFPKWWTWITSNHFAKSPGTVLAVGGGEPKILGTYILQGLCIGLRHAGKEYAFRTTDLLNWVDFEISWGKWEVVAQNSKNERIEISAYAPPEKFMDLQFQTPEGPVFHDYEALLGSLTVRLYRWSTLEGRWNLVTNLKSNYAGIEWGSPTPLETLPNFRFISPR